MTLTFQHHPDRLVVPFDGELTWPRATEFVDAVDAHIEHYHYRRVELVVASPGGLVAALEHIVRALSRWRTRGVEVRTRVVASAESAAAVLVSLGDERTAAPGAKLLYHLARVPEAGAVTARASAELHGELTRADARIVGHLVERALAARGPVAHRAEPRDREALERIVGALAGHAPTEGRRPRLKRLPRQYAGVLASARTACAELASPRLATTLYFGCEPGWREVRGSAVDFARLASPDADGRLLLYQPRRDGLDALLGMALKAGFFEAVLAEPARIRAEPDLPLVGYVADECHRFVTADAVHGEQSFLETCRSHGAFVSLISQATRSIAHALSLGGAGWDRGAREGASPMSPTIPSTAGHWSATGSCSLCAAPVVPDGFRDRAAYRDFHITGLCQACQDELYFRPSVADARMRYPVRRGVLAAPAVRDGVVVELGLLPFLCIVPEARVEWEARWLLRAGAGLAPLDPWHELEPAEPVLRSHQIRLTEVADLGGAEVCAALDVDFAVVLDAPARDALAGLPLKDSALCLALADGLRSRARLGPPLDGLLAYWLREPVSVVRACALLVLALAAPAGRGRTRPGALGPLLQHPTRFPGSERRVLAALRETAWRETVRLWAARAPIEHKDALKARGYRWMPETRRGIERAWWTEVVPEMIDAELEWLRETIYPAGVLPHIPQRRVTAHDRWRADPSDVAHRAQATPATPAPFAAQTPHDELESAPCMSTPPSPARDRTR